MTRKACGGRRVWIRNVVVPPGPGKACVGGDWDTERGRTVHDQEGVWREESGDTKRGRTAQDQEGVRGRKARIRSVVVLPMSGKMCACRQAPPF